MKHIVILILALSILATRKEPLAPLVTKIIEQKTQVPPDDTTKPKPAEPEPVIAPEPAEPKPVVAPKPTDTVPKLTNAAQAEWDNMCKNPEKAFMIEFCKSPGIKPVWYKYTWPTILSQKINEEVRRKKAEAEAELKAEAEAEAEAELKAEEAERQRKAKAEAKRKSAEEQAQLEARKREMLRVYNEAKSSHDKETQDYRNAKWHATRKQSVYNDLFCAVYSYDRRCSGTDKSRGASLLEKDFRGNKDLARSNLHGEAANALSEAKNSEDDARSRSDIAKVGFQRIEKYYNKHKTRPTKRHLATMKQKYEAMWFRVLHHRKNYGEFCKLGDNRARAWCFGLTRRGG